MPGPRIYPICRSGTLNRLPIIVPLVSAATRLVQASPIALQNAQQSFGGHGSGGDDAPESPDSPAFFFKAIVSVALVLAGGVFAGLTLALMGSDDMHLRVLATSSEDEKERKAASKVLRLLGRGRHWVLVVLLLSNVVVNESLPIFLNDVLGGGVWAVIVSTTMIVIFGEVIPQAICVRYGLAIGGFCAPLVLAMMWLFAPIAYPAAKVLDWALGSDEGHTFRKAELKTFLQFHKEGSEPLRDDEITILNGVLSLNDKKAQELMTPIDDVLCLPSDKVLDHATIDAIVLSGFSRIPVYEPDQKYNFTGMLLVKRLISYNPEECKKVSQFPLLSLPEARPDINCELPFSALGSRLCTADVGVNMQVSKSSGLLMRALYACFPKALDYFQTGRAHLLLISENPGLPGGALGIVSLEDLIEEIIGEEIVDETDRFVDNHSKKRVKRERTSAVMRGIIERHRKGYTLSGNNSREGSPIVSGRLSLNGKPLNMEGKLIDIDGEPYAKITGESEVVPESNGMAAITGLEVVEESPSEYDGESSTGSGKFGRRGSHSSNQSGETRGRR